MITVKYIKDISIIERKFNSVDDFVSSHIDEDNVLIKISFGSLELDLDEIHKRNFYTIGDFVRWCETED